MILSQSQIVAGALPKYADVAKITAEPVGGSAGFAGSKMPSFAESSLTVPTVEISHCVSLIGKCSLAYSALILAVKFGCGDGINTAKTVM